MSTETPQEKPPETPLKTQADPTKGLFASKTFWGVVMMLVATTGETLFGLPLDDLLGDDVAQSLGTIGGAVLAVYGRIKAGSRIDDVW